MTLTQATITLFSPYGLYGNYGTPTAFKAGRVVYLSGFALANGSAGNAGILPAGFRPMNKTFLPNTGSKPLGSVVIDPDGTIVCWNGHATDPAITHCAFAGLSFVAAP